MPVDSFLFSSHSCYFLRHVQVSFAGALMGFASKNPYTGILVAPYTIISPANQVVLVPMTAMFAGMAVGLAAAPTGVHAFGSELVVYWREASVGHSKGAYYIGKSFSNSCESPMLM